jgi:hypothetical protein
MYMSVAVTWRPLTSSIAETSNGVTGRDAHQRRLKYHHAFGALVEHLDLDRGGLGRAGQTHDTREGAEHHHLAHCRLLLRCKICEPHRSS